MKSIILDHCFVCGARFVTAIPAGKANEERHHMVPRAFGGEDGPMVSLCDGCHSKVHKHALSRSPSILQGMSPDECKRLTYLSNIIYNAKRVMSKDPNKLLPVSFKITKEEAQRIDKLKSVYNVGSRADVYKIALAQLFSKTFSAH